MAVSNPAWSVRLKAGEECARPLSCFQWLCCVKESAALVDAERTRFLDVVYAWSGTLKVAVLGLEKRLWAMEVVGTKSSEELEDASEGTSSSKGGLFLLSFSVISGSIDRRVRSCQPCWALKLANARQSCRLRAT